MTPEQRAILESLRDYLKDRANYGGNPHWKVDNCDWMNKEIATFISIRTGLDQADKGDTVEFDEKRLADES